MNQNIKLQDLHSHCRTCLCLFYGQRHDLKELACTLVDIGWLSYAGLKIPQSDIFPNSICEQCYDMIKQFDEFQDKLRESTKQLEGLLKQAESEITVEKTEPNEQKQGDDPLKDNGGFESVLVKLEIEIGKSLSDEASEDENEYISHDPIVENEEDLSYEHVEESTDVADKGTTEIICKYGCGRKFRRMHNAQIHYHFKHKSEKNSEPPTTPLRKTIKEELAEKYDSTLKTTCKICFKSFATFGGLRSHMSTHGEARPFQCDQCNRGFNMKARLKRHIRETHQDNPPEIPCKYGCGKIFIRHESAMNHYRVKHILPEKGIVPKTNTYVCEDCGKTFKTMYNLKEHSYTHRPHSERPFQCDQCQKRFVSKRPYEVHLLRHAGIKNFECNICGLKTTTHNELRNHMNHHTKERQVNCPICSKTYTNPDNLRRHTLIVHQGVKNYKCRFCDEKFGKPDHLKHHEMRHTGERPHRCQICDRGFIQLVALRAHMKTHNKATNIAEKSVN